MPPRILRINATSLELRQAAVEEIIPLRHRILRAGLPIEEAHFDGDREPTTHHVAAFDGMAAVGCATLVLNPWEGEPAWQLRGMATDAAWQRCGVGQAVWQYAVDCAIESSPVRLLWCNARVPALEFYKRQGWEVVSEQFEIPTAGPHRKMIRNLKRSQGIVR